MKLEKWLELGGQRVKVGVFVPRENMDEVRLAIGKAGGGVIGNYGFCAFVTSGKGYFLPLEGANPAIGKVGEFESVEEYRLEFECPVEKVESVVEAILEAHPYEEVPIDIFPLLELK